MVYKVRSLYDVQLGQMVSSWHYTSLSKAGTSRKAFRFLKRKSLLLWATSQLSCWASISGKQKNCQFWSFTRDSLMDFGLVRNKWTTVLQYLSMYKNGNLYPAHAETHLYYVYSCECIFVCVCLWMPVADIDYYSLWLSTWGGACLCVSVCLSVCICVC